VEIGSGEKRKGKRKKKYCAMRGATGECAELVRGKSQEREKLTRSSKKLIEPEKKRVSHLEWCQGEEWGRRKGRKNNRRKTVGALG